MSNSPFPRGPTNHDAGLTESGSPAPGQPSGAAADHGETLQRQVTIMNPQGFHMRPATAFAQLAGQFQSTVTLCKGDQRINGKSPLELLFLAAEQGDELLLEVAGSDARCAIDALAQFLATPSVDDASDAT